VYDNWNRVFGNSALGKLQVILIVVGVVTASWGIGDSVSFLYNITLLIILDSVVT